MVVVMSPSVLLKYILFDVAYISKGYCAPAGTSLIWCEPVVVGVLANPIGFWSEGIIVFVVLFEIKYEVSSADWDIFAQKLTVKLSPGLKL